MEKNRSLKMELQRKVLGLNRKSLLCLITCLLLLLTSFGWYNTSIVPAAGVLVVDQQQTTVDGYSQIRNISSNWQSFTPSVDNITGVSLLIYNYNIENPSGRYLNISIDDNSDGSSPLANGTIDLSALAYHTYTWFDFIFPTVSITISLTYYIIVTDPTYTSETEEMEFAMAASILTDAYSGGQMKGYPNYDWAFKTYYGDPVFPELSIAAEAFYPDNMTYTYRIVERFSQVPITGATVTVLFNATQYSATDEDNGYYEVVLPYSSDPEIIDVTVEKTDIVTQTFTYSVYVDPPAVGKPPVDEYDPSALATFGLFSLVFVAPWIAVMGMQWTQRKKKNGR